MSQPTEPLPKFSDEARERAYWESHDSSLHVDWTTAKKVNLPNLNPTTETVSLETVPTISGIDFETLLEYARIGIRRASIFMGFGVQAAASPAIRNFDLSKETKLRLVQDTTDDKLLGEYKQEFRSWVIVNGLREIHEAFTEYLEKLNQACLSIEWVTGGLTPDACDARRKKFDRAGLSDKFEILRKVFGVISQHE